MTPNHESQPPSNRIKRSAGVTPAERYLKKLCEASFLSLWSYPSVYRDQKSGVKGDGKEVADLIVVFGDDIIIFSDKHCVFPNTGDTGLDWSRWFRKAVANSAQQAWGAERWLRTYPERLFLDRACAQRFPIEIPSQERARFHLIIVAHDGSQRCKTELGGSGSFMIRSDLKELAAHKDPFTIGDLDPSRSFVHVLDDTTLKVLLRNLDTVSDFTAYLRKKEALLRSRKVIFAAGEEELLAVYLTRINPNGDHDFIFPRDSANADVLILSEGHWSGFELNPQRQAQLQANKVSYVWDRLIEKFNRYTLAGEHYFPTPSPFESSERIMRFLAAEPRTRRRMLARSLVHLLEKTGRDLRATRVILPSEAGDPYYVFLLLPLSDNHTYQQNREIRREFLHACCLVTKLQFPNAKDIIGIATETASNSNTRSEDAVYLDARDWSRPQYDDARELREKLQILIAPQQSRFSEKEYPNIVRTGRIVPPSNPRNKLCPCGSHKKYKNCHGR